MSPHFPAISKPPHFKSKQSLQSRLKLRTSDAEHCMASAAPANQESIHGFEPGAMRKVHWNAEAGRYTLGRCVLVVILCAIPIRRLWKPSFGV